MANQDDVKIKVSAIVENQKGVRELQKDLSATGDVSEDLGQTIDKLAESFDELTTADKLRARLEDTAKASIDAGKAYDDAALALGDMKTAFEEAQKIMTPEQIAAQSKEIKRQEREIKALESAQSKANKAHERAQKAVDNASESVRKLVNDNEEYNRTLNRTAASQAHVTRELERLKGFNEAYDTAGIKDLESEIENLEKAYKTLKESGKLSANELKQAHENLQKEIKANRRELDGTADAVKNMKSAAIAMAPIAAGFALVGKAAIDYEDKLADVKKVVTATDEEFAKLNTTLLNMSKTTPVSAAGLAEIAAAGAQLGVTIDNLQGFVEVTANMATAFGINAEAAGKAVANLSNIFNISINDTERLGDAINHLSNNSAAAADQIVDVLVRIGAQGKAIGLAEQEVAALGSSLIAFGKTPEIAGTALNSFLTRLQTLKTLGPTGQMALQKMGVSAADLGARLKDDASEGIIYFLEQVDKMAQTDKAEALTAIFGAGPQADVLQMATNVEALKVQFGLVGDELSYVNSMQTEAEARAATTASQIQLLKNSMNALSIEMGTKLLPVINKGVSAVGTYTEALSNFAEANPQLVKMITYLGLAIPLGKAFGAAVTMAAAKVASLGAAAKGATASTIALNVAAATLSKTLKGIVVPFIVIDMAVKAFDNLTESIRAQNAVIEAHKKANDMIIEMKRRVIDANEALKKSTASLTLEQIKSGEATKEQINEINLLSENLERLGLTYDSIIEGISKEAKIAITTFEQIGESSFAVGKVLGQSFAAAMDSIKTPEEMLRMISAFQELESAGRLTGVEIDEVSARIDELRVSMQLGTVTQDDFNKRKAEIVDLLKNESGAFAAVNHELSKNIELINDQIKLNKQLNDSIIRKLNAEMEMAKAIGDTVKQQQIQQQINAVRVQGMKQEAAQVAKLVEAYQKELAALEKRVEMGETLTADEQKRMRALKVEIEARGNEVEAIKASAEAKLIDSANADKNTQSLNALAGAANRAAAAQRSVAESVQKTSDSLAHVTSKSGAQGGFQSWLKGMADESLKSAAALDALKKATAEVNKSIVSAGRISRTVLMREGQKNQLREEIVSEIKYFEALEKQMQDTSGMSAAHLRGLENQAKSLKYVNEEAVKSLTQAAQQARQQVESVYADLDRQNAELVNKLSSMRNQDDMHTLRMRQTNERMEAERKIREAQEKGDNEEIKRLNTQLALITQIHGQEQRTLREEQRKQSRDKKQKIDINLNGKALDNVDVENKADMEKISRAVVGVIKEEKQRSQTFVIRG